MTEAESRTQKFIYLLDISLKDALLVEKMDYAYKGKTIFPTKTALNEVSDIGIDMYDIPSILEKGFEIRKRKKNIIERGIQKGNRVINVVVVDMGNYYKLIHAGEFTLSKKFKKIMREEHGI